MTPCVIRRKVATDSDFIRPPIPKETGHFLRRIGILFQPRKQRWIIFNNDREWTERQEKRLAARAGKTYLACALGDAACRNGFTVQYYQTVKLLRELKAAHIDGSFEKLLKEICKSRLLILDDWLLDSLNLDQTRDLLEIMDDRFNLCALKADISICS